MIKKLFKGITKNWETSVAGLVFIVAEAQEFWATMSALLTPEFLDTVQAVAVAIGLFLARSFNKTSEESGAK